MIARERVVSRKQLGGAELHSILRYMKDFGHGRTIAEQTSGNIVLYVDDARDVDLLKQILSRGS